MLAAAWVTAGATVGLLIGAAITAWFAFETWTSQLVAMTTQLMDVGLIARQARRDAAERRRAQAAQIFTWVDTETSVGDLVVRVSNSSQQPIYDLAITLPTGTE